MSFPLPREAAGMEGLELLKALRDGRCGIRYFPRVALKPIGVVTGATECLVRSCGGDWQVVPLSHNLSEETLTQLWRWKLGQLGTAYMAVKELERSPSRGANRFSISLNLHTTQLNSEEWAFELMKTLDATGVPGGFIELQLAAPDTPGSAAVLDQCTFDLLRNTGVTLALKAFPSSAFSLVQLAQGEFGKVIIDRSLVPKMHESLTVWARKRNLLAGLVALAESVGAGAVIDGIDEPGQLNFLDKLAQVEWQGAYWGSAADLGSLLSGVRGRQDLAPGLVC
jgi:EAL domain-containing protein (putative c-di-GMP-specific phosphodiesterase class I)